MRDEVNESRASTGTQEVLYLQFKPFQGFQELQDLEIGRAHV